MESRRVYTGRLRAWAKRGLGSALATAAALGTGKMLLDIRGGPPSASGREPIAQPAVLSPDTTPKTEPLELKTAVDLFHDCSRSVVKVLAFGKEGNRGQGSGFFVTPNGWVVTNEHVIRNKSNYKIELSDGALVSVKRVVAIDRQADLAILNAGVDHAHLTLEKQELPIGSKVYAIGSPRELNNTLSEGLLSGYRSLSTGTRHLQTTAPISPGSSGGPLLDGRGRVLGVACGFREDGQNLNFAVASERVRELMDLGEACARDMGAPRWWIAQALRQLSIGEPGSEEQNLCLEIATAANRMNDPALETIALKKADRLPSSLEARQTEQEKLTECSILLEMGDLPAACRAASGISETKTRGQALALISGQLSKKISAPELLAWIENLDGPGDLRARACLGALGMREGGHYQPLNSFD